jgi:hypothetical protein
MGKPPRKPNSVRKPPTASESRAEIEAWIRRVMPEVHPIVTYLDETIRAELPGVQYAIKWSKAYYGLPSRGWVIELAAYHVSVNVVFLGGADFDSPPPMGDTDRTRYVKVRTLSEAQAPELRRWITEARRVPCWR